LLVLLDRQQRLPAGQMLGAVEVAGGDNRKTELSDPVEEREAVADLEWVDRGRGPVRVRGETARRARSGRSVRGGVGVRRDQRRPGVARFLEGSVEAAGQTH